MSSNVQLKLIEWILRSLGDAPSTCDVCSVGVISYTNLSMCVRAIFITIILSSYHLRYLRFPDLYGSEWRRRHGHYYVPCEKDVHCHSHWFNPVSAAAKDFIVKCLTKSVMLRPTASGAQKHSWFRMLRDPRAGVFVGVWETEKLAKSRCALAPMDGTGGCTLCTDHTKKQRNEWVKFDVNSSREISFERLKHA